MCQANARYLWHAIRTPFCSRFCGSGHHPETFSRVACTTIGMLRSSHGLLRIYYDSNYESGAPAFYDILSHISFRCAFCAAQVPA
ncbi:hypothetical protein Y032_0042g694 [Ancylostoma ceylanicum]|uniref:Uncharacterized protein n=1 Tax=Ancylostoma ceylanicum TaxID=53326 RepID=A0A016UHL1_9BILA|nr:hypothetical protein Y032_0042g694 [Ancylostoma ceylanicum]